MATTAPSGDTLELGFNSDDQQQFRAILDVLVPPDDIEVRDAFGNTYNLPAAVPARAQIEILRRVETIREAGILDNLNVDLAGGMAGMAGTLVALGSSEEVMSAIAEAFALAHPTAVAGAKAHAKKHKIKVKDAADLFPVEELVAGLIPLFARLVQRAAQAANLMTTMDEA